MKTPPVGSELFHADRRTYMTKPISAVHNFKAILGPKIGNSLQCKVGYKNDIGISLRAVCNAACIRQNRIGWMSKCQHSANKCVQYVQCPP